MSGRPPSPPGSRRRIVCDSDEGTYFASCPSGAFDCRDDSRTFCKKGGPFLEPFQDPWQPLQDPAFWDGPGWAPPVLGPAPRPDVRYAAQRCGALPPAQAEACMCQALKGPEACPEPLGDAALVGAAARARIY